MLGAPDPLDRAKELPQGEVVGTYTSYLEAQKAVDYLADQQFPVELVAIVGNELKLVERVTGRLSYPKAALNGALSGMWFGLFVGVLLSFFSSGAGYFSIITSVLMGAAFFMLFGVVTYAMQRGRRDFTSTSQVVPSSYDVVVGFEASAEARRLLHQLMTGQGHSAGHQGHQGGGPQEGPQGWTDPHHAQHPAQGEEERTPAQREHGGSGYHDLPDGQPQYGIRIEQDHPRDRQGGPVHHGS
jgi:hypothetical protein